MDARSGTSSDIAHNVPKRREVRDARVPGLRRRIGARRSTWVLICKIGRHASRHTIGHFPAMTRAQARAEALRRCLTSVVRHAADKMQDVSALGSDQLGDATKREGPCACRVRFRAPNAGLCA